MACPKCRNYSPKELMFSYKNIGLRYVLCGLNRKDVDTTSTLAFKDVLSPQMQQALNKSAQYEVVTLNNDACMQLYTTQKTFHT